MVLLKGLCPSICVHNRIGSSLPVVRMENRVPFPVQEFLQLCCMWNPKEFWFVLFFNESYVKYHCIRNSLLPKVLSLTFGSKMKTKLNILNGYGDTFRWRNLECCCRKGSPVCVAALPHTPWSLPLTPWWPPGNGGRSSCCKPRGPGTAAHVPFIYAPTQISALSCRLLPRDAWRLHSACLSS